MPDKPRQQFPECQDADFSSALVNLDFSILFQLDFSVVVNADFFTLFQLDFSVVVKVDFSTLFNPAGILTTSLFALRIS